MLTVLPSTTFHHVIQPHVYLVDLSDTGFPKMFREKPYFAPSSSQ